MCTPIRNLFVFSILTLCFFLSDAHANERLRLCLKQSNGKVIVKKRCSRRETVVDAQALEALSVAQQGEQGMPGEQGVQGPIGPVGPQGIAGPRGEKGEKGEKGDQGIRGERGVTGLTGARGPQGLVGPRGATGVQGVKGDTGARGLAGKDGVSGYTIVTTEIRVGTNIKAQDKVLCPVGMAVLGGGILPKSNTTKAVVTASYPDTDGVSLGWGGVMQNTADRRVVFEIRAICAYAQ